MLYPFGGSLLTKTNSREVWHWERLPNHDDVSGTVAMAQWGNLLQGLRLDSAGLIDGIWASTGESPLQNPYLRLRSFSNDVETISQQAVAAVELQVGSQSGKTALVLGCPGGRVRVFVPGAMRVDDLAAHVLGSGAAVPSTEDQGIGVSALAVKHVVTGGAEQLDIWFATIASADKRPMLYHDHDAVLDENAFGTGALHKVTWFPSSSGFSAVTTWSMKPTASNLRGAGPVVGLLLADVIQEPPLTPSEDELVVATLSGDLIVFKPSTMAELMRTFVPGGIGCYNALRAENLGGASGKELYVAGSCGLWRFIQLGG